MGGDHHGHGIKIPDYTIYKVDDAPPLAKVRDALAKRGLKDPWLRNHVWRYNKDISGGTAPFKRLLTLLSRGVRVGSGLFFANIIVEELYKKFRPPPPEHPVHKPKCDSDENNLGVESNSIDVPEIKLPPDPCPPLTGVPESKLKESNAGQVPDTDNKKFGVCVENVWSEDENTQESKESTTYQTDSNAQKHGTNFKDIVVQTRPKTDSQVCDSNLESIIVEKRMISPPSNEVQDSATSSKEERDISTPIEDSSSFNGIPSDSYNKHRMKGRTHPDYYPEILKENTSSETTEESDDRRQI